MTPPFKLRNLIVAAAGATALLLLALTVFSALEIDRHRDALDWMEHTHAAVDQLEEALLQVKITELARQAFLSTGAAASRDGVRRAAESVRWTAESLQKFTADNPGQAARAEALATASAEIRASVETRAHRGAPAEGSPAAKRAESLIRTMEAEERALLVERRLREQRSAVFALAALGTEVLLAGLLAAVTLGLILRGLDERDRLLLELERTRTLMQTVFDHAQAAVSLIDLDGRLLFVNQEYARILGTLPRAAGGRPLIDFLPAKEAASILAENARIHASGASFEGEEAFTGASGPRVYLSRKVPMPAFRDRPAAVCCISTDITALKSHERALLDANAELDAFAYSVAHDLRAPLRAIEGFASILVREHPNSLEAEPLRLLGRVRSNAARMSRLIDDLLAFSRLGRQALREDDADMGALARRAAADAAAAEPARDVRLVIGDLPPCRGDAAMLALVWNNLVSNAYKYTRPRAPANIEIGGAVRDGAVEYWIKDDGVGFDQRYAGKLFGVFSRLHGIAEFEGTGVGLALVRRVIERHGGRISASGAVDRGASFRFTLPQRRTA